MNIKIGYLYADLMNIYGDTGNIIALQHRSTLRGIDVEVKTISIRSPYKEGGVDILFFGGGQDASQINVSIDLLKTKGEIIKKEVERGVPLLSICGGYQLLGEYYQTKSEGLSLRSKIKGTGLFPVYTIAGDERMIGDIIVDSSFGKLIGFENHSGQTFLHENANQLGTVLKGYGNNGQDKTEGCKYKNAIGCYMHGSLLPKNPKLTDWLIKTALSVKYNKNIELNDIDTSFEEKAREYFIGQYL